MNGSWADSPCAIFHEPMPIPLSVDHLAETRSFGWKWSASIQVRNPLARQIAFFVGCPTPFRIRSEIHHLELRFFSDFALQNRRRLPLDLSKSVQPDISSDNVGLPTTPLIRT
jgi:hypothetical protein